MSDYDGVRLRPYRSTDFEQVMGLWYSSWHSSSSYKHHRPLEDWKHRWRALEKDHTIVVLAHHAGIVSFAALNKQDCILSQFFVSVDHKRKGLGKKLLDWAFTQCSNGFTLKTAADNQESRAFYESQGLISIGQSINDFNGYPEVQYARHPLV